MKEEWFISFVSFVVSGILGALAFYLLDIALFSVNREDANKGGDKDFQFGHQGGVSGDTDFETPLRKFTLEAVKKVDLAKFYAAKDYPRFWNEKLARIFSLALKISAITKGEAYSCLDKEIKRNGRLCFEQHMKGTYPDHTFWLAAFAYALQNGEFSDEEILKIRFDHEQTVETFIKRYGERDLLEKSFLRLLPPHNE